MPESEPVGLDQFGLLQLANAQLATTRNKPVTRNAPVRQKNKRRSA